MTNPNDAVGTNAAYGTRTSVNAFNDIAQLVNGRGILSGWSVVPKTGMTVEVGGIAGTRDVAIAEDNLGNRTTINNKSNNPIEITLGAASASSNRYDAIVVYVNNPAQAADETPDAPSVCGIIAVQGGTTGVSEAQIRNAISADGGTGSVAYYAVIATILVGAGTSTITSANISQSHIAISASDIADGEITSSMINWPSMYTEFTGTTEGNGFVAVPNNIVKPGTGIIFGAVRVSSDAGEQDGILLVYTDHAQDRFTLKFLNWQMSPIANNSVKIGILYCLI
jgi:hypothetical protein